MLVTFPHQISFTNKETLLVKDVAASLLANEQILLNVGRVLEKCVDGLAVESVSINFVSATTNSPLKEALSAGILLTFQDDLKREVPRLIEKIMGVHVDEHYTTVVTIIFLIIAIYGIEQAWQMFKSHRKDDDSKPGIPQIQGNFNTVLNVGGNLIGIEPEKLKAAVSDSFSGKQKRLLAKQALAFIQPAKREQGAAIEGAGILIEAETIEAAPSALDIEMADDRASPESYPEQKVVIHATDKDHAKSGWAGHIPGVWEKRIPMKLFPGIAPSLLFGKEDIVADLILVFRKDAEGDDVPEAMHILKIYD